MLEIIRRVRHSETTLSFYFIEVVDDEIVLEIADLTKCVRDNVEGCIEVVACGTSMFVEFHVIQTDAEKVTREVIDLLDKFNNSKHEEVTEVKKIELPVYYGAEVAVDLAMLAEEKKLTVDEVVKIHSNAVYKVISLGFAPGFAYLSGLDERLVIPRMSTPKTVTKGSLGIADRQTAVYPKTSPGGWVIIGNCPVELFDVRAGNVEEISPFEVGAEVRFVPVSRDEFIKLGGQL